jgi:DNA-binding transcriptional ArsR family regulator
MPTRERYDQTSVYLSEGGETVLNDHCDLLCLDVPRAEELRRDRLTPERAREAASAAQALADPTRLTLAAALLDGGELCVCDLSWIAERSQPLVSHHVRALREARLVRDRREGKMVMYSLTASGRHLLQQVLATGPRAEDDVGEPGSVGSAVK